MKKTAAGESLARIRKSPGQYFVNSARSEGALFRAAALHEAGHAVVAIALEKFKVEFVILDVTPPYKNFSVGGYCQTSFQGMATPEQTRAAYDSPDMLRLRAIQLLAGPAAEWIGHEDADGAEDVDRGGENDDRRAVELALNAVGRDEYLAYFKSCNDEAHRLVREHWPACVAVANYLLSHLNQQMPGALVEQLVAAKGLS